MQLSDEELVQLVKTVFSPRPDDIRLAILTDLPDPVRHDRDLWQKRRIIAFDWWNKLDQRKSDICLHTVDLLAYPNVHSQNADLPQAAYSIGSRNDWMLAETGKGTLSSIAFSRILAEHSLVLAMTEFSATAPLKLMAPRFGFRAATMPGFSEAMVPALRLDYSVIDRRVRYLKQLLDSADEITIDFRTDPASRCSVRFDLRYRTAHASGGLLHEPGTAGNLPSGESYIVPYEGEKGESSRSSGTLPVQFEDEIVLYRVEKNRAVEVMSRGTHSDRERSKIRKEPAYGNIAEIGFGVLRDFGIQPIGEILLDEKLGLHIAFGRSDHFGGAVGAGDFSSPDQVVHVDRIYIPEIQDRIRVECAVLHRGNKKTTLIQDDRYLIFRAENGFA